MNNTEEFYTIVLAGLLHDIGKFWQRAGGTLTEEDERLKAYCCPDNKYFHVLYSGKFVREIFKRKYNLIENLVLYHHYPENAPDNCRRLVKIIQLADWLSSGERRDKTNGDKTEDIGKEPLLSIFSITSIDDKNPDIKPHYVPLSPLNLDLNNIFPTEEKSYAISKNSYSIHWQNFYNEVTHLSDDQPSIFLVSRLMYILEKYTITIPSAVYQNQPDITLYHHLKTTSAIASCLWRHNLTERRLDSIINGVRNSEKSTLDEMSCLLVAGDVSGIQEFIYSVTSEKALKGLKGRSFYLQLFAEGFTKSIIKQFGLTECNILYSAGGNFFILLPNLEAIKDGLDNIKSSLNKNILSAHRGKLSVNLVYIPVRYGDFVDYGFGNIWQEAKTKLAYEKRRKFSSLLEDPAWIPKILGHFEQGGERKVCEICGEELQEGEDSPCPLCKSFEELAYDLPRARFIQEEFVNPHELKERAKTWEELLGAMGIRFSLLPEATKKENAYLLNSSDFSHRGYAGFRFLAQSAPMVGNNVMTLEEIASNSSGIKKWGILRADVDNLGKIFSRGIPTHLKTISRMTMLSEMLTLFFNAHVEAIARSIDFKDRLYIIYSGGDDLLAIGEWSILPNFIKKLYEDFQAFTARKLTLSASIYIAPAIKFPVYQSADYSKSLLEEAKTGVKNKLNFLGKNIPWKELEKLEEIKDKIINLLDEKGPKLPRSLLQIIYQGWLEKERVEKGEIGMIRIWRFLYAMKRLKERYPQYVEQIDELEKSVMINKELYPYLDVAARWAEFLTRKEV